MYILSAVKKRVKIRDIFYCQKIFKFSLIIQTKKEVLLCQFSYTLRILLKISANRYFIFIKISNYFYHIKIKAEHKIKK